MSTNPHGEGDFSAGLSSTSASADNSQYPHAESFLSSALSLEQTTAQGASPDLAGDQYRTFGVSASQEFAPISWEDLQASLDGWDPSHGFTEHTPTYDVLYPFAPNLDNDPTEYVRLLLEPTPAGYEFNPGVDYSNAESMWFHPDGTVPSGQPPTSSVNMVPEAPILPDSAQVAVPDHVPDRCPRGCTGTFSRPGEYRRHMKKHTGPRHLCNQPNCTKSFYRADKLRDHLWQGHRIETRQRTRGRRQS